MPIDRRHKNTGRPPKLNRNLAICKLVDDGMLLREAAEQYGLKKSNVTQIVQRFWERYSNLKEE